MKRITLFAMLFISINAWAGLTRGIEGHQAGDIIAVASDEQIAAWCNFDKQIVMTKLNVLCVYNGNKAQIS